MPPIDPDPGMPIANAAVAEQFECAFSRWLVRSWRQIAGVARKQAALLQQRSNRHVEDAGGLTMKLHRHFHDLIGPGVDGDGAGRGFAVETAHVTSISPFTLSSASGEKPPCSHSSSALKMMVRWSTSYSKGLLRLSSREPMVERVV